jgi:uncharacterized protein (TIGR00730 family)
MLLLKIQGDIAFEAFDSLIFDNSRFSSFSNCLKAMLTKLLKMNPIKKVCIFCASSAKVGNKYLRDAEILGREMARNGIDVVYGAGAAGLMGRLANAVLAEGGRITGIIPEFMSKMQWAHNHLSELVEVKDMRERKDLMIREADAVIALPGGVGTLEELTEVITLKQLGQFFAPVIIVNTDGFYNHLIEFFDKMIGEQFMRQRHKDIWVVVGGPLEVISAIHRSEPWDDKAIHFAAIHDD